MFLRYGLAFATHVLKNRAPERVFWMDPFSNNAKLMYFLGPDTETFFPPNKKDFESSYGLKMVDEATRKLIFPTPDPFLEAKKVLASPGLWGKLGFRTGSFFLWKKKVLTSHKLNPSAINRGPRRLWKIVEKLYVTQWIPFARSKKKIGRLLEPKTTTTPPRSERAFRNARFAFCVLTVLRKKVMIPESTKGSHATFGKVLKCSQTWPCSSAPRYVYIIIYSNTWVVLFWGGAVDIS